MRRAAIALAMLGLLFAAVPALAQVNDFEIFLDQIVRGDPGSIHEVYNEPVPAALVGRTCAGAAATENNASEHLNNDLIIASGGASTEILNFEAVAGGTTFTTGTVTFGPTLVLSVRLGPSGISSGGLAVVFSCQPEPTTTTTTPTTTTTAPPPAATTTTTAPPPGATTTTEAPPVGGIQAGGGGTATGAGPAAPWVAGGALLLAAALGAVAVGRAVVTRRD